MTKVWSLIELATMAAGVLFWLVGPPTLPASVAEAMAGLQIAAGIIGAVLVGAGVVVGWLIWRAQTAPPFE